MGDKTHQGERSPHKSKNGICKPIIHYTGLSRDPWGRLKHIFGMTLFEAGVGALGGGSASNQEDPAETDDVTCISMKGIHDNN